MSLIKNSTDSFVADGNDALEFKLVRKVTDLEDDSCSFKPEMTHQVFGDNETIFGYRDLKIKLYYSAARLSPYLGIVYSEKVDPKLHDGCKPDDIFKQVSEILQSGFCTNLDDFSNNILDKDASFTPFGELKHSFSVESATSSKKTYEIYYCDVREPGFLSFHERVQTFILFYIDAANFIDVDDEGWRFFFVFEKYILEGAPRYAFAGYATTYEYYAYPLNIRPRISQMLVLPPYRRQGLACHLLTAIYQHYKELTKVVDITVEDPSEDFQRIRDFVDVKNCSTLSCFQPVKLKCGFNDEMASEARIKLKLSKNQTRRVYEILRLKNTNVANKDDYRKYRLCIKQRLNAPHQKQQCVLDKLQKILKPQDYQATLSVFLASNDQRQDNLDRDYHELELQYRQVLDRLENE